MNATMAQPRSTRPRATSQVLAAVAAALVSAAALVPIARQLDDLPRTDFAVRNDTVWSIALLVHTDADSVVPLTSVGPGRTTSLREVAIPPGDSWAFEWRWAGNTVGTTTVSFDELDDPDFVLAVPDEVTRALEDLDAPPAP